MKNVTEVDLNSILETLMGRTTPPTDAENTAHRAAGGLWRWVSTYNGEFLHWASKDLANWYPHDPLRTTRKFLTQKESDINITRWWPLNAQGELVAWPKVTP